METAYPANPQVITEMVEKVKENSMLLGMSMNTNSIILYVPQEKNIDTLFNQIHKITISNKETIAMAVKKDLVFTQNQRRRTWRKPRASSAKSAKTCASTA